MILEQLDTYLRRAVRLWAVHSACDTPLIPFSLGASLSSFMIASSLSLLSFTLLCSL